MENIEKLSSAQVTAKMEVINMADIEIKPVEWLWDKRMACGKITVIAGQPGLGKSQITGFIAAVVTNGGSMNWPDVDHKLPPAEVLILSAEDDPEDTIKPRLVAAGADIKRCHVVKAVKTSKNEQAVSRTFDLNQDINSLEKVINQIGKVKLVIIDPVSAYQGRTDSHNNSDVRGQMTPYSELAAKYGFSLILVTHFNKSTSQEPIERIIGSIGLIAAARSGYAVTKDAKDEKKRYFVPLKNNIGIDDEGFSYSIQQVELDEGIITSKISWDPGLVKVKDAFSNESETKPTATNAAGEFLLDLLKDGSVDKAVIDEEAEGAGYSKSTLQRAKHRLGIKSRKKGFDDVWEWYLDDTATQ